MITTLTGQNSFMLHQELKSLIDSFISEYGDIGLERLDGEEASYDRMRESLESLPFLASRKLVVLRSPGAQKEFAENAEALFKNLPENIDVIIVEPKLDKRLSYFKFLKKTTDFKEYNELDAQHLSRWLVEQAKAAGGSLKPNDASMLISRLGVNQQLLSMELEKLLLYNPEITKESIINLTDKAPQSTIFDLLEAALSGRKQQAIELYEEQRALRVEPVQIMALLAWQLHILALIKSASARTADTIASEARLSPYVVRKSKAIADRMTYEELKLLVQRAAELDVRLKSESIDADEAMLELIVTLDNPK